MELAQTVCTESASPFWIQTVLVKLTALLSMRLSNTSTSALMYPIAIAVCRETAAVEQKDESLEDDLRHENDSETPVEDGQLLAENDEDCRAQKDIGNLEKGKEGNSGGRREVNMEKAMLLAVTYSSTFGGICTTIGTPPNLVAIGIISKTFGDQVEAMNFVTWFAFCLPISIIGLVVTWLWLQIRFLNIRELKVVKNGKSEKRVKRALRNAYAALPPMGFAEITIVMHFVIMILLWFMRDPKIIPGWKNAFPNGYAKDSTVSLLFGLSMFLFPSKSTSFTWIRRIRVRDEEKNVSPAPPLLEWETYQRKFPWNVVLLLGSGFALAGACVESGLSEWVGQQLTVLHGMPTWVLVLVVSTTVSFLTEFTSNTATASIILPVLIGISTDMGLNPLILILTGTLSCSFAFALPISTPPNTMAFGYGSLKVRDMIYTGVPLNIVCIALLGFFIYLTGNAIFHLDTMPEWATLNATIQSNVSSTP